MANYKDIKGFHVQNIDGDPPNPIVGDMYYNTSAGQFKVVKEGGAPLGAWASGTAMSTTRQQGATAQLAPTTAAQVAGGGGPGSLTTNNEQYNGSTWSEVAELTTGRFGQGGTGTQTAAISAAGFTTTWVTNNETWNGASWTEVSEVGTARFQMACAGTSTAAVIAGGEGTPASTPYARTESWNGAS